MKTTRKTAALAVLGAAVIIAVAAVALGLSGITHAGGATPTLAAGSGDVCHVDAYSAGPWSPSDTSTITSVYEYYCYPSNSSSYSFPFQDWGPVLGVGRSELGFFPYYEQHPDCPSDTQYYTVKRYVTRFPVAWPWYYHYPPVVYAKIQGEIRLTAGAQPAAVSVYAANWGDTWPGVPAAWNSEQTLLLSQDVSSSDWTTFEAEIDKNLVTSGEPWWFNVIVRSSDENVEGQFDVRIVRLILALENPVPVASCPNFPQEVQVGEELTFDASASCDQDGQIASYAWDFGDGTSGEGQEPTHAYTDAGSHRITLTVTDNDGLTSSCSAYVLVGPIAPHASFWDWPWNPQVREAVTFDASSSGDEDGQIVSYAWDFGDGTSGDGEVATHAYTRAGSYTVTLTVTDDDGLTSSSAQSLDVQGVATPVLLVYGWHGRTENWNLIKPWLEQDGYPVEILSYDDSQHANVAADTLAAKVEQMLLDYDVDQVDIIAHSWGGLVSRYYIEQMGGDAKVKNLVMIGTPNYGSHLADYAIDRWGDAASQNLVKTFLDFYASIIPESKWGSTLDLTTVQDRPDYDFLDTLNFGFHSSRISTHYFVIAGTGHYPKPYFSASMFLPGQDDGIVRVGSASLEGKGVPLYCVALDHSSLVNPYGVRGREPEEQQSRAEVLLDSEYIGIIRPILEGSPPASWDYACPQGEDPDDSQLLLEVLERFKTRLNPWDTADGGFDVPPGTDRIEIGFTFSSSDFEFTLTRPTGRQITPEVARQDPDINFFAAEGYWYYLVAHPEIGPWQYHITAIEVPEEGEDIEVIYVAEAAATDMDGDGLANFFDNCPLTPNPDQADADGDGRGDPCDPDDDNDTVDDVIDNCPLMANADQADMDGDRIGDACDPDIDGDGFTNEEEAAAGSDPHNAASVPERCDRTDNDLDGVVDDGFPSMISSFLQPVNDPAPNRDAMSVFKQGSTVPVKFRLYHCNGTIYSDAEAQTLAGAGKASLLITAGAVDPSLVVDEAVTSTQADQGNRFRYDPVADQFIYNWGTKSYAGGGKIYTVVAAVVDVGGNVVRHGVNLALR